MSSEGEVLRAESRKSGAAVRIKVCEWREKKKERVSAAARKKER